MLIRRADRIMKMFIEVPSFQIYKLLIIGITEFFVFLPIHFQNPKTYRKLAPLIFLNNFASKHNLFNH